MVDLDILDVDTSAILLVTDATDLLGARIVLFVGRNFETCQVRQCDQELLKRRLLQQMNSFEGAFTILYLNTDASSSSPGMTWIRRIHEGLDRRRRDELSQVVVVHPSLTF